MAPGIESVIASDCHSFIGDDNDILSNRIAYLQDLYYYRLTLYVVMFDIVFYVQF